MHSRTKQYKIYSVSRTARLVNRNISTHSYSQIIWSTLAAKKWKEERSNWLSTTMWLCTIPLNSLLGVTRAVKDRFTTNS